MSTQDPNPQDPNAGRQPSEEELMAAYEEQMRNVRVEEVLVQSLASMIELGGRRAGLAPGADGQPDPADPEQLRVAIEAIKALQPVAAPLLGPNAGQVDQALAQLQVAYAKLTGAPADGGAAGGAAPADGGGQPAAGQQPPNQPGGGRLWVPGQ